MSLSYKDVADILKIIDASECQEVILELGGMRLEVRRGGTAATVPASRPAVASVPAPSMAPVALAQRVAPAAPVPVPMPAATAVAPPAEGQVQIRAPMVGTFYRRPSPTEKPFVEVGQRVKKGDPLCLIEVMKLFTTVAAPADGVVGSIGAEDAALVAFDQLLIVLNSA